MPYLDQVINGKFLFIQKSHISSLFLNSETLRMHPPFTAISKECTEEIDIEYIKGKNITIEKGTNVYLPLHQFQHDPEYYPRPKEFIPERFDPEHGGVKAFKDRGVFLTFGDGPRFCLGMKFAMMQSKAAVLEVIKNFKISVNPKTESELVIDPNEFMNVKKGGLWLNFKPVKMFKI
jgi:cytochrome P450 family 28